MSYQILMISGPQGSGKSSTANAICDELKGMRSPPYDLILVKKFADSIYAIHDQTLDMMEKLSGIPRIKKDGKLLQFLGTEWGRDNFGPNIWVNILTKSIAEDIAAFPDSKILFVIDDCRFPNEFDALPSALRVRLNAPESVRKMRAESWRENTSHLSEISLDIYENSEMFDMFFDTGLAHNTISHISTLVIAQLQKDNWQEKRSKNVKPLL